MYSTRLTHGPVDLAFTDRYGGVSVVPYDELNLALVGGDDPEAVAQNHRLVLDDFAPGAALADMSQVHGADVAQVPSAGPGEDSTRPTCDGLVTDATDVVLMVRVADCVPVLLADPGAGVVGVAHAGRAGLVAGVVPAVVARMHELGADAVEAWVGPRVCGGCYEVPSALQREVLAAVPEAGATTTWGTPSLDVGAGVLAQLRAAGVRTTDVGGCTRELPGLYSFRRDAASSGRLAGLVRLRGEGR